MDLSVFRFQSKFASATVLLFASIFMIGCGGDATYTATDEDRFTGLVTSLQEAAGTPGSFATLFAQDAVPNDETREQMRNFAYQLMSWEISGDAAILTVTVYEPKDYSAVGEVQWNAARQDGSWRLTAVSLP
jgi:hypothetical protein